MSLALNLRERIKRVARHSNPCIYRGPTLRKEKQSCCGIVEIFQCSERKHEVQHTKCRTCEYYTIDRPSKPLQELPKCVFRGILPSGTNLCNQTGTIKKILDSICLTCPKREW